MPTSFTMTSGLALAAALCLLTAARAQSAGEQAGALVAKLKSDDHRVQSVAFSPDGRLLAAGYGFYDEGGVTVWRVSDRAVVARPPSGRWRKAGVRKVAFSPDGKFFAAATDRGDVMLWAVGSWRSHRTVLSNGGRTTDLAFSPDGARLVYSSDKAVILYELQSGRADVVAKGDGRGKDFVGVSFSPDGRSLIVCGGGSVRVWDVEGRKESRVWEHAATSFFGSMSPDGRRVVAGGGAVYGPKSVELRSFPDGRVEHELSEFRNGLFALAISHTGRLFAVGGGTYSSSGGDLSLWDAEGARELGFVSFGESPIQGLAFSPDDRTLAAASESGYVLLYDVERLRGPQVKRQAEPLCGEVSVEGGDAFIVPLSKVPTPMSREFEFPWKLQVANAEAVASAAGLPVVLEDWAIESGAGTDRARVAKLRPLLPRDRSAASTTEHVVFGHTQNPGWNESFAVKVYGDGTFVAANNAGKCLASGRLGQLKTDFESLKRRLVGEGLLSVPKEPLTLGADHYGTLFIELSAGGAAELRSDADDVMTLLKGGPAKKREAFWRIFRLEDAFVNSLLRAGMAPPEK